MGFAFEEGSGLPMVVGPDQAVGHPALPLLALHVQPEPVQSPEAQIGDIMLKVQRFADETAEDARRQARAVVADAQIEAAGIVTRARREAGKIAAQVALQAT